MDQDRPINIWTPRWDDEKSESVEPVTTSSSSSTTITDAISSVPVTTDASTSITDFQSRLDEWLSSDFFTNSSSLFDNFDSVGDLDAPVLAGQPMSTLSSSAATMIAAEMKSADPGTDDDITEDINLIEEAGASADEVIGSVTSTDQIIDGTESRTLADRIADIKLPKPRASQRSKYRNLTSNAPKTGQSAGGSGSSSSSSKSKIGKEMTLKTLQRICRNTSGMYELFELNTGSLFFNSQSFNEISEAITNYSFATALHLNSNLIGNIQYLNGYLTRLRALFLENNCIESMKGIEELTELRNLNLANNSIKQISHLDKLTHLCSLDLSGNLIKSVNDCTNLVKCPSLATLYLSNNRINEINEESNDESKTETDLIDNILNELPNLRSLYMRGNPFVNSMEHYRRTLVIALPNLIYLDTHPVFAEERNAHLKAVGRFKQLEDEKFDAKQTAEKLKRRTNLEKYRKRLEAYTARIMRENYKPHYASEATMIDVLGSDSDESTGPIESDDFSDGSGVAKFSISATLRDIAAGSVEVSQPVSDNEEDDHPRRAGSPEDRSDSVSLTEVMATMNISKLPKNAAQALDAKTPSFFGALDDAAFESHSRSVESEESTAGLCASDVHSDDQYNLKAYGKGDTVDFNSRFRLPGETFEVIEY